MSFEYIAKYIVLHCQEIDPVCCMGTTSESLLGLCYENATDACIEECTHRFCRTCIQHNLEVVNLVTFCLDWKVVSDMSERVPSYY